jgi:hypothetical protein
MSVNPPEGTLTIENSHLDVKGNVSAVALKLGTLDDECHWQAPVTRPEGSYMWNEETQSWDEDNLLL